MGDKSESVVIRDAVTLEGARVPSPSVTTIPERGLAIQPQFASNPTALRPSVTTAINFDASRTWTNLTTTALAAGSTYTSGSVDGANYCSAGLYIRSDQPVSVEIQESHDGTTFARTHVFYLGEGPARTYHGIILFQLSQRYWRVLVTNIGYATQTTFRVDRVTIALPVVLCVSHHLATVERTTTALGAGATYTSRTYNTQNMQRIGFYVYADQAGTVYYDVSFDGATWRTVKSVSVAAGATLSDFFEPTGHFVRLRYVNGATAQGAFDFTLFVRNNIG